MNKAAFRKIGIPSVFCIAVMTFGLYLPLTCHGAEYSMEVDFSPNIIKIDSQRWGEIRVFTDVAYSVYIANEGEAFIYFNDCHPSVENIRATRDSWGNLILKFNLEDLLALEECLIVDALNTVQVVVGMNTEGGYIEYKYSDKAVYLGHKKSLE